MNKSLSILIILGFFSCYVGEELPPDQDVWGYVYPTEVGLDDASLFRMDTAVKTGSYEQINGIILIKDDQLVFENYYNDVKRDDIKPVGRVTFSILTLALDLFIQDGYIHLDHPIHTYLPEYASIFQNDSLKRLITIRHLIAFKSGLVWSETVGGHGDENDLSRMEAKEDWARHVLSRPMEAPPGLRTVFNSGGGVVIAKILQNQLGDQPLLTYLKNNLFSKIGIEEIVWEKDPAGTLNGTKGLSLKTRDFARFGYLMLNEGRWKNKKRVISRDWIFNITSKITEIDRYYSFGYSWWLFSDTFSRSFLNLDENTCFFAAGENGQNLYVIPGKNMVVCISAANYSARFSNPSLFLFVRSLESLQPAPAN